MDFAWHDEKSDACQAERGFGFDYAARLFDGSFSERIDDRQDYGEVRIQALGTIDGLTYVVVYNDRIDDHGQPVRWIISARRARAKEVRKWRSGI